MSAHTPGPWSIKDGMIVAPPDDPTEYYEEQIGVVYRTEAWTSGEPIETEDQANAALIAAAPDLLAEHVENARILGFLWDELQGRVEAGKLAAIGNCLRRCTDVIAKAAGDAA